MKRPSKWAKGFNKGQQKRIHRRLAKWAENAKLAAGAKQRVRPMPRFTGRYAVAFGFNVVSKLVSP